MSETICNENIKVKADKCPQYVRNNNIKMKNDTYRKLIRYDNIKMTDNTNSNCYATMILK